jgi:hypothetical protein
VRVSATTDRPLFVLWEDRCSNSLKLTGAAI